MIPIRALVADRRSGTVVAQHQPLVRVQIEAVELGPDSERAAEVPRTARELVVAQPGAAAKFAQALEPASGSSARISTAAPMPRASLLTLRQYDVP